MNKLRHILLASVLIVTLRVGAWEWWPLPFTPAQVTWDADTSHDSLYYFGEISSVISTNGGAPTMLYRNEFGNIANRQYSGNLSLGVYKPATRPNRWFDYDGAVVLTGRVQSGAGRWTGYFRQLYGHVRLTIIDVTIGIKPFETAVGDEQLSMGDLLFSNNAHPIPRVTIGIDKYTPFPGMYGYFEIRGGITHGWLDDNNQYVKGTYLHHKFVGGRIGGDLPVNITYEFHHAAQWGGHSDEYGDLGNDIKTLGKVFTASSGGNLHNEKYNAIGNHILSQTLCLTAKGKGWKIDLYWKDIHEDKPISFIGCTANAADGLWGIYAEQKYWPFINAVTLEVMNTTDQSGPFHDRDGLVFGGNDSYYANSIYRQGWTYYGRVIGNAMIAPDDSRVMAAHIGVRGDVFGFRYRLTAQHSRHYGTYNNPHKSHNTAVALDVKKQVKKAFGMEFGIRLAADFGTKYENRFGAMITVSKSGIITNWK